MVLTRETVFGDLADRLAHHCEHCLVQEPRIVQ